MPDGIPRPTAEAMGRARMTALSPPTDDAIREWKRVAEGRRQWGVTVTERELGRWLCDAAGALLDLREAHSATKAALANVVRWLTEEGHRPVNRGCEGCGVLYSLAASPGLPSTEDTQ